MEQVPENYTDGLDQGLSANLGIVTYVDDRGPFYMLGISTGFGETEQSDYYRIPLSNKPR